MELDLSATDQLAPLRDRHDKALPIQAQWIDLHRPYQGPDGGEVGLGSRMEEKHAPG